MPTANFGLLVEVAEHLRPVLHEVVFLGGCTTELFLTDPGAAEVRATTDVDVAVEITSWIKYNDFSDRLRAMGLRRGKKKAGNAARQI